MLGKGRAEDDGGGASTGPTTGVAGAALWKRKLAEMAATDNARKMFKTTLHSLLVRAYMCMSFHPHVRVAGAAVV